MNDLVVPDASRVIYDSAVGGVGGGGGVWGTTIYDHLQHVNEFGANVWLFKITFTVKRWHTGIHKCIRNTENLTTVNS